MNVVIVDEYVHVVVNNYALRAVHFVHHIAAVVVVVVGSSVLLYLRQIDDCYRQMQRDDDVHSHDDVD